MPPEVSKYIVPAMGTPRSGYRQEHSESVDEVPVEIHSRVGWRRIAGDVVSYDCASHTVAVWNEAASLLWEEISKGSRTIVELTATLVRTYRVSPRQARAHVRAFLASLRHLGSSSDPADSAQPADPELGQPILRDLERRAIHARVPFAAVFETTFRCNERCIHCFVDEGSAELSLPEIKRILGELAEAGCLFLTLTGGEFFIRGDALDILRIATERRFVVDILTNGTLIDEGVARILADSTVRRVQVSLYGSTAELHDSVTRRVGSFRATLSGVAAARAAGVRVEIAMPLLRPNFGDARATRALAEGLGCSFLPSPLISARNSGATDTHALRLSDDELVAFLGDTELGALYRGRRPFEEHQHYMGVTDLQCASPCYSGFCTCAIRPNGDVTPCNQLLLPIGNLRRTHFQQLWETSPVLLRLRAITVSDLPVCSTCKLLPACARCPGLALLEGGDLYGISPENCRTARMRVRLNNRTALAGSAEGTNVKEVIYETEA